MDALRRMIKTSINLQKPKGAFIKSLVSVEIALSAERSSPGVDELNEWKLAL